MNSRTMIAGVAALLLVGNGASAVARQSGATMAQGEPQSTRNRQLVEAAFDRWAAGGSRFFDEMLADDVIWTIKGSGPSAGTFRGRETFVARAVRPFADRLATPVRPVSRRVWTDGDHVIVNWDGVGTARDGQAYRNSYAWIFRMANGKVVEATAFLDLVPYDDVLRRIPPSPSRR